MAMSNSNTEIDQDKYKTPTSMSAEGRTNTRANSSPNVNQLPPIYYYKSRTESTSSDKSLEQMNIDEPEVKKIDLSTRCVPRYKKDFQELGPIGEGKFGLVVKCKNNFDNCIYAIKIQQTKKFSNKKEDEVNALAKLALGEHVIRYFSAWTERKCLLIQTEYCDGGNLANAIWNCRAKNEVFSEKELKVLVLHGAKGLKCIHSNGMVHLDIKPSNICRSVNKCELTKNDEPFIYKIGDFGHVVELKDNPVDVDEGDGRYAAREALTLDGNPETLTKADVFSFGLTVYEAGICKPLPSIGEEWRKLRRGELETLENCSAEFNALLQKMVCEDHRVRPSAVELCKNRVVWPIGKKIEETQAEFEIASSGLQRRLAVSRFVGVSECKSKSLPFM